MTYADDLEVMVRGWFALTDLEKHADQVGPIVLFEQTAPAWCGPCSRFASSLVRGTSPADALHLRCPEAQALQRRVDAATAVAKAHGVELGLFPKEEM